MSERSFQQALFYLYRTIDEHPTHPESSLSQFELSDYEMALLEELIKTQRRGLTLFNRQLHHKGHRSIRGALVHSSKIATRELDSLIDEYTSSQFVVEGLRDPAEAVRFFAQYLCFTLDTRGALSKQLELIYLESVAFAVSLPRKPLRRGEQSAHCFSSRLKLSSSGDVSLVRCTYDTVAVLSDPALFQACEQFVIPRWLLLFQGQEGEVRIMAVSSALAGTLKSLQNGVPLEDIAREIEDRAQRDALRTAIEGLLSSGVPFVCKSHLSEPSSQYH